MTGQRSMQAKLWKEGNGRRRKKFIFLRMLFLLVNNYFNMNFDEKHFRSTMPGEEFSYFPDYRYMMPPVWDYSYYQFEEKRREMMVMPYSHPYYECPPILAPLLPQEYSFKEDSLYNSPLSLKAEESADKKTQVKKECLEGNFQSPSNTVKQECVNRVEFPCKYLEEVLAEQREWIIRIFQNSPKDELNYHHILNQVWGMDPNFVEMMKTIYDRLKSFKKSKEEMIKYIIRKTQRAYKVNFKCKKDSRFVKYGGFKSMNTQYLQTMFRDTLFINSFQDLASHFVEDYENENYKKIETVLDMLKMCRNPTLPDLVGRLLSEKNRMPWPLLYRKKMVAVYLELLDTYAPSKPEVGENLKKFLKS